MTLVVRLRPSLQELEILWDLAVSSMDRAMRSFLILGTVWTRIGFFGVEAADVPVCSLFPYYSKCVTPYKPWNRVLGSFAGTTVKPNIIRIFYMLWSYRDRKGRYLLCVLDHTLPLLMLVLTACREVLLDRSASFALAEQKWDLRCKTTKLDWRTRWFSPNGIICTIIPWLYVKNT